MTPNQFYDKLLKATSVDPETMDAARKSATNSAPRW